MYLTFALKRRAKQEHPEVMAALGSEKSEIVSVAHLTKHNILILLPKLLLQVVLPL